VITAGFNYGMPARVYHADPAPEPSLSSGVARTILAKSLAHAHLEHPRLGAHEKKETTAAMSRGSIVHALLSGTASDEIAVGDFATFRSKAAQEWAEEVEAAGKLAALECDMDDARFIADAVRAKAGIGLTSDPFDSGFPEASAFWQRGDAWYRARYDRLIQPGNEPATAWDWKTIEDVSPQSVKRAMRRYRYDLQAAHYLAGLDALIPAFRGLHSFVFCFVETSAPYSVRRYVLTTDTLACAAIDINRAHDLWAKALKTNEWPDASIGMTTRIDLPTYDDDSDGEIAT
jgi:hypothetical protein